MVSHMKGGTLTAKADGPSRVHQRTHLQRPIAGVRIGRRTSGEGSESKDQNPQIRDGVRVHESSVREPRSAGMVGAARSRNNQLASNRHGWTNSVPATSRQKLQTSGCTVRTEGDVER